MKQIIHSNHMPEAHVHCALLGIYTRRAIAFNIPKLPHRTPKTQRKPGALRTRSPAFQC